MCKPTYVYNSPGGLGKIPLVPMENIEQVKNGYKLTTWENKIIKKDIEFLDHIQMEMATARQFLFIARCKNMKAPQVFNLANRVEKTISEQGFEVHRLSKSEIKRFLALYFDASLNGEHMPDIDGEQFFDTEKLYEQEVESDGKKT